MNGQWIYAQDHPDTDRFYYFTKKFDARRGYSLSLKACADSRYQLYLNGTLLLEGPCQGDMIERYYDECECSSLLRDGENILFVKVLFLSEHNFMTVSRRFNPALWVMAELKNGSEDLSFRSDDSWECMRDDGVLFQDGPGVHYSMPPFEIVSKDTKLVPVKLCNWYETDLEKGSYCYYGISDRYVLAKRPIPQMEVQDAKPFQIVRQGDGFIELDAGKYTTAKVHFTFKNNKPGENIKIIYSECYEIPDGNGGFYKNLRDNSQEGVLRGVFDLVESRGDEQTFEPFWYRAFRYIRIEFSGKLDLTRADFEGYFYPMTISGSFESSDPTHTKMWDISINTVRCCMHELYVDCPYYEQQQYDMDGALESLFTYRLTNDTTMQRKILTDMAKSQTPDGMIRANYPSIDTQIIPNFSLFWIFMLRDYMENTGDIKLVRSLTGTMDKVLEGFRTNLDERGLYGTTKYWPFVDWEPEWTLGVPNGGLEEPLTVSTLMYSAALRASSYICRVCGRDHLANDYLERSNEANKNAIKYCYDTKAQMFRNTPSRNEFSEHTTVWAVLAEAFTGDDAHSLMERTLSGSVTRCTFSMNHYMFRALEKSGCYSRADQILNGWRKMIDMHCTTWCENPDSPRSECHTWSSAPIYELSAVILGVRPGKPGYESIQISPYTEALDYARGVVPTVRGNITVEWKKFDGKIVMDAIVPDGLETAVMLSGKTKFFNCSKIHFEA